MDRLVIFFYIEDMETVVVIVFLCDVSIFAMRNVATRLAFRHSDNRSRDVTFTSPEY